MDATINGQAISDWMGQFTDKQEAKLYTIGAQVESFLQRDGYKCSMTVKYMVALNALESNGWTLRRASQQVTENYYTGLLSHLVGQYGK